METLAFLHYAIACEESHSAPALRTFEALPLNLPIPLTASLVALSVAGISLNLADTGEAIMYPGDRGPGVARLQEALVIRADGVYGLDTAAAVRDFQRRGGLVVDGVAGAQTLIALGLPADLGPGQEVPTGGSAYVTAGIGLNVRDAPAGVILYAIPYGTTVSLTGLERFAAGRTWSQLSNGGWVASQFLSSGGGGGDVPVSGSAVVATNSGIGLNVRAVPAGRRIGGLAEGTPVALTGAREVRHRYTWVQLRQGGWVAEAYLRYR